jgi:hypothetical protein
MYIFTVSCSIHSIAGVKNAANKFQECPHSSIFSGRRDTKERIKYRWQNWPKTVLFRRLSLKMRNEWSRNDSLNLAIVWSNLWASVFFFFLRSAEHPVSRRVLSLSGPHLPELSKNSFWRDIL